MSEHLPANDAAGAAEVPFGENFAEYAAVHARFVMERREGLEPSSSP